jgi:hypothetical protein
MVLSSFSEERSSFFFLGPFIYFILATYFLSGWDDFSKRTNSLINVAKQGIEHKLVHTQHLEEMLGLFGIDILGLNL